ncbi:hypothetical protein CEXT_602181 [Caerostris extrusa]|uniref:Uncharacterized protein n=1 Tax=Caerostris extrusa TaxID=172846 RepID=A0AAV4T2K9_CAEEX|nr:hypothetical protein CEXT_602181 [Caerostris extrusa]
MGDGVDTGVGIRDTWRRKNHFTVFYTVIDEGVRAKSIQNDWKFFTLDSRAKKGFFFFLKMVKWPLNVRNHLRFKGSNEILRNKLKKELIS